MVEFIDGFSKIGVVEVDFFTQIEKLFFDVSIIIHLVKTFNLALYLLIFLFNVW